MRSPTRGLPGILIISHRLGYHAQQRLSLRDPVLEASRDHRLPAGRQVRPVIACEEAGLLSVGAAAWKGAETSTEVAYGRTDHSAQSADPARLPAFNRALWGIEAHHDILEIWNWEEDPCTIRTGHGPQDITRLHRFAVGLIKSKSSDSVAATIGKLARNVRRIFDYLRMTGNSNPRSRTQPGPAGQNGFAMLTPSTLLDISCALGL